MLDIRYSSQFKKDIRRIKRQGKDLEKLREAISLLAQGVAIPAHYLDHSLRGQWNEYREIHIDNDWLLIYRKTAKELLLVSTGSHSELFDR
ncbi:type II toxin-antitoxin system YafQ family toxin [Acetomicrobium thermoterrenum]|uniref:type II toxin-antitoxin system YafQ family toxin n=1 Tax=Acetomicrobium thermoterrenum TaxID=1120986 RepID=UPI000B8339CE|nr:type II toxin-antitoxin system YafQ family toxin [Acetomicrobium thermoterrenum]